MDLGISGRAAGCRPLPNPGTELAHDTVFIHLATQSQEWTQLAGIQPRESLAGSAWSVPAIATQEVADHDLIFQPPDLGDAQSGVNRQAVEQQGGGWNITAENCSLLCTAPLAWRSGLSLT